jgi:hypothetical protein
MPTRILLIFCILAWCLPAFSQEDDQDSIPLRKEEKKPHKGFIGISAGPSWPVGNFGKNNDGNENAGFAERGYNFNGIDFGYKFVPSFGLALSFKGANVPLDVQTIANNYAQEYGGEFTVKSTRWNYGGIYIGPIVSIPTKIIDIDFRLMTGLMVAFAPDIDIRRGTEYVNQKGSAGPSISVSLGSGLRYHLSRSFSITAGFDYLLARPVFNVEYTSNNSIESETVYQNITIINTNFGIAFRIF